MELDETTDFGARVARRLRDEEIVWLVTTREDGGPEPSPVWFDWDGTAMLIYSHAGAPKLRNIAARPRVALHFNSTPTGEDVVVFTGEATIDESAPPATEVPTYLAKYRDGISRIGLTPDGFAAEYSVPIRVTPTKVRGH